MNIAFAVGVLLALLGGFYLGHRFGVQVGQRIAMVKVFGESVIEEAEMLCKDVEEIYFHLKGKLQ